MKSGGGVFCVGTLQFIVGLVLLGIYEGYKTHYLNDLGLSKTDGEGETTLVLERKTVFKTPMDFLFYLAVVNNVFSVFGIAGIINAQKELVMAFFTYNAVQMVTSSHYFVDILTDIGIRGKPVSVTKYEQTAAAFVFFNFLLSIAATVFAMKAIDEIKVKQREEYNRLSVLSDTLQYEPDARA